MFIRNVDIYLHGYTLPKPRKLSSFQKVAIFSMSFLHFFIKSINPKVMHREYNAVCGIAIIRLSGNNARGLVYSEK
jgi:hypothetical protein